MPDTDDLTTFHPPTGLGPRLWPYLRHVLNFIGGTGITIATGGYSYFSAPFHVEYPRIDLPLRNLHPSFDGFRIVQLSDLHAIRKTPMPFLRRVVEQVNAIGYDLCCVTGDLLSSRVSHAPAVADLLATLRPPVLVTFGNHDYSHTGDPWNSAEVADALEEELTRRGITVLRNRAVPVERSGGGRIWVVGLEDFWSLKFRPDDAFAAVNHDEPVVAMSHNPDSVYALVRHRPQWVLAGHTHGGQINLPIAGAVILPVRNKQFVHGQFQVEGVRMYVTRGVGFKIRARFRCPAEVPVFTLRKA